MNRKIRNFLLLLALILALGGALWLLSRGGGEEEDAPLDHSHDVSDTDETGRHSGILIDRQAGDLRQVYFRNGEAAYTAYLDADAGEIEFRELEGLPVNHNLMETVWFSVPQMIYQDVIASGDTSDVPLAVYGLDKPALTVKATFAGGDTCTFHAGSNVPGYEDDVYYVRVEGRPQIYACTLDVAFFMGNRYYLSDDIFYAYDADLKNKNDITIGAITLSGDAFDGRFVMKPYRTVDLSDPFSDYSYLVTSPVRWPVRNAAASVLVDELTYLMAEDVAVLRPTRKQLRTYGLASPALTVSFTRNGKACVLYASKPQKNRMYVMLKGQSIVYQLHTDSLSILHELTPENLYALQALSLSVEAVNGLTIQGSSADVSLKVSRSENKNASAENDAIYTYSATADGRDIPYGHYTNFLKQLNSSTIRRWNIKKPSGSPDFTLTVTYFASYGRKADTIRFYRASDREYAVAWGDHPVQTVTATWVRQLLDDVGRL